MLGDMVRYRDRPWKSRGTMFTPAGKIIELWECGCESLSAEPVQPGEMPIFYGELAESLTREAEPC